MEYHITLPSKPRVVSEEGNQGVYEIDSLYPGYGHTLGNSLPRIVLSSIPGATITQINIDGVPHEFASMEGVRETVMELILNLKRVHFVLHGDEPQTIKLTAKGAGAITAKDFSLPSQVEITNPEQHVAELSEKTNLVLEATIERGLGYVPRDVLTKGKADIGTIALDATFTPIRRVNYEVENMRVGDRTDFNRLRFLIETNGTVAPREALERSIETMIHQLTAIVGFKDGGNAPASESMSGTTEKGSVPAASKEADPSKLKLSELELSARIASALEEAGIKSAAGLARKTPSALKELDGIGDKAVREIMDALATVGLSLKAE